MPLTDGPGVSRFQGWWHILVSSSLDREAHFRPVCEGHFWLPEDCPQFSRGKIWRNLGKIRSSVKQRLCGIAHKFQSCSEVSAQEVSFHLLCLPLSQCSRANVYVNTNPPEQRTRILKLKHVLKEMESDSDDILQQGLIEHYAQRPDSLENTCLASFAAW